MRNSRRAAFALATGLLLSGCGEADRPPAIAGYLAADEAGKIGVANVCRVYESESGRQISTKLRLVNGKNRSWLSQDSPVGGAREVDWKELAKPTPTVSKVDQDAYARGSESFQEMPCQFNIGNIAIRSGAPEIKEGIYHFILNNKLQVEQAVGPVTGETTADMRLPRYDVTPPAPQ